MPSIRVASFGSPRVEEPHTALEAAELAAFIKAGSIVYVSGDSGKGEEINYNHLILHMNLV
jgi:hypothetical protein